MSAKGENIEGFRKRIQSELEDENFLDDTRKIMDTPEGRRFLRFWRRMLRTEEPSFTGNAMIYLYEGIREVGLWLDRSLRDASFEQYLMIQREDREQEILEEELLENERKEREEENVGRNYD